MYGSYCANSLYQSTNLHRFENAFFNFEHLVRQYKWKKAKKKVSFNPAPFVLPYLQSFINRKNMEKKTFFLKSAYGRSLSLFSRLSVTSAERKHSIPTKFLWLFNGAQCMICRTFDYI